ncbi:MAG: sulfur carrier protein ThiS adenylyltransferase ThiF [Deltaproteobacteria bacterium]|nr:sulfur carrier protein ThiS adenylyltransferase ThiF [Deltaproteobacteria bacterium]
MSDLTPNIFGRNAPGSTAILSEATVAVAGCGGLGSNAAVALVRAGVGTLILVDPDVVEASNLNRQHFFQADIGRPKVEALADHLWAINPDLQLELHRLTLTRELVPTVFAAADLLIEAFDRAESKQWLIEAWCRAFPQKTIVCASGVSGLGNSEAIKVRRAGKLVLCGDERSEPSEGLCSARVAVVANLQANCAIEELIKAGRGVAPAGAPVEAPRDGESR